MSTDNTLERANRRLAILLGLLALGIFVAFCWSAMT
jgi:hypothetical protein